MTTSRDSVASFASVRKPFAWGSFEAAVTGIGRNGSLFASPSVAGSFDREDPQESANPSLGALMAGEPVGIFFKPNFVARIGKRALLRLRPGWRAIYE